MKKAFYLIISLILLTNNLNAQDVITKRNGEDINAKVLEISDLEVKYKKFDFLDGPTYTEKKSEILIIRYENGSKDIFEEEVKEKIVITPYRPKSNVNRDGLPALKGVNTEDGREDARRYYRAQNTGAGWTGVTAALTTPVFGLIPAVICSSTVPKDFNLDYPDDDLMDDYDYAYSYRNEAKRIKSKKVWGGFAIGTAVWLVSFVLVYGY